MTTALLAIRPISADDGDALVRFHGRLSPETQRRRFLVYHPVLAAREVERFTHVDHRRREALVAESGGNIVGVARFDRIGADCAEVAIVVADQWQRLGVGASLLRRLADRAREEGVRAFVADTLPDNVAVDRFLAGVGAVSERVVEDGVARLRIELDAGGAP